jgi:hypothetical protein
MIAIGWHVLRMILLRSWAAGLAALWIEPAGKMLLAAIVAVGAMVGWSAWQREIGRDQERALAATLTAEAEARAMKQSAWTVQQHVELVIADDKEEATIVAQEGKVRDESVNAVAAAKRDDVLWRDDDRWLRSKRR